MQLPGRSNHTCFGPGARNISRGRSADGILVSLSSLLSRPGVTCLPDRGGCLGTGQRSHAQLERPSEAGPQRGRGGWRRADSHVPQAQQSLGHTHASSPRPSWPHQDRQGSSGVSGAGRRKVGGIRCRPEVTCRRAAVQAAGSWFLRPRGSGLQGQWQGCLWHSRAGGTSQEEWRLTSCGPGSRGVTEGLPVRPKG